MSEWKFRSNMWLWRQVFSKWGEQGGRNLDHKTLPRNVCYVNSQKIFIVNYFSIEFENILYFMKAENSESRFGMFEKSVNNFFLSFLDQQPLHQYEIALNNWTKFTIPKCFIRTMQIWINFIFHYPEKRLW